MGSGEDRSTSRKTDEWKHVGERNRAAAGSADVNCRAARRVDTSPIPPKPVREQGLKQ